MKTDYEDIFDNPDEEQVERQWRILQAIRRSSGVTKQELVWERKVSERTIERDIQTLSRMGFPILDEIDGREKRYHFMQHYEFPSISLDIFEYLSLTLAQDMLSFLSGTPYYSDFIKAMQKIRSAIPPESQQYLERIRKFIVFQSRPIKDFKRVSPMIQIAQKATTGQQRLELTYKSTRSGEIIIRMVDPYGIYQAENALRLVGYCHLRQDYREFNFDGRMVDLVMLDETFEPQQSFNLSEYTSSGFGVIKGDSVQAVIRLEPPVSRWVREREWDGLTKTVELEDDAIELHFDTDGRQGLFRQILEWGGCAEVIEPPDFRQQILNEIKKMQSKYTNGNSD